MTELLLEGLAKKFVKPTSSIDIIPAPIPAVDFPTEAAEKRSRNHRVIYIFSISKVSKRFDDTNKGSTFFFRGANVRQKVWRRVSIDLVHSRPCLQVRKRIWKGTIVMEPSRKKQQIEFNTSQIHLGEVEGKKKVRSDRNLLRAKKLFPSSAPNNVERKKIYIFYECGSKLFSPWNPLRWEVREKVLILKSNMSFNWDNMSLAVVSQMCRCWKARKRLSNYWNFLSIEPKSSLNDFFFCSSCDGKSFFLLIEFRV